ncbi:hypothetical protein CFK37_03680 [Virgibacillus phasianinus]|uniref:DUF3955 domain-containing protein n=1 Tax=Virgibacillus phasianinus TaxID=2017483 RepID=A0A220U007_9BACI|nr:hypothetical protein CFK37_03680 [Virgibacillus phasianinus]
MKKFEWLIAAALVIIGLNCLTVSATTMWEYHSINSYLKTFAHLCLWMGLPVLVVGIIYIIFLLKKRNDKK